MDFDLLIKNGTVIDGTGMPRKNVDIGIKGDKICFVGGYISENSYHSIADDRLFHHR